MEASSPLAALHPGRGLLSPWGLHEDVSGFGSGFLRPCSYGMASFNFRDMSMLKSKPDPKPDYFSCRPIRGSSPTASLAVDLSQNFYIDKSPQFPTPRRSLFTSNLLDASHRPTIVTPPILSSSPMPLPDSMDFSPLPHKQPQQISATLFNLCSPTPEATPELSQDELPASPRPPPPPSFNCAQSQPVPLQSPPTRRASASALGRPVLRKTYSSAGIISKPRSSSNSTTPFLFGPGSAFASQAPLETFAESPPSERKLVTSASNGSLAGTAVSNSPFLGNGSPLAAPVRRPPHRVGRMGMGRRSHSVQYSNSFKPMRQEKRCCTTGSYQPSSITLDVHKLKLPHFVPEDDPESLPRITKDTAVDLLNGAYMDSVGQHAIIDCRFEYEYQGGHISGAYNFNDKEELAKQLFEAKSINASVLVFHCEYSACRAPLMASFIRQRDRAINQDNYPHLTYPEVYILDGGYSGFFKQYSAHCFPQNYVEMHDEKFETACELGMAKVKRRAKLGRAQTYAFGQASSKPAEQRSTTIIPSIYTDLSYTDSMQLDSSPLQESPMFLTRMSRGFGSSLLTNFS